MVMIQTRLRPEIEKRTDSARRLSTVLYCIEAPRRGSEDMVEILVGAKMAHESVAKYTPTKIDLELALAKTPTHSFFHFRCTGLFALDRF